MNPKPLPPDVIRQWKYHKALKAMMIRQILGLHHYYPIRPYFCMA